MSQKQKIYLGMAVVGILIIVPFSYFVYLTLQILDSQPGTTVHQVDEDDVLEEPEDLDIFRSRRDLPGRSTPIVSEERPPQPADEVIDENEAPEMDTEPVSAGAQSQFFADSEPDQVPSETDVPDEVAPDDTVAPSDTDESDDDARDTAEDAASSGIEVIGVDVRDVDGAGEQVAWEEEGTIVGLDRDMERFTLTLGGGDDRSYSIDVTGDTDVYVQQDLLDFSALTVGDIVEVTGRAAASSREIQADTVRVVAELQLFDDGQ